MVKLFNDSDTLGLNSDSIRKSMEKLDKILSNELFSSISHIEFKLVEFVKKAANAFIDGKIRIDEGYVRIPRAYFAEEWIKFYQEQYGSQPPKEEKAGKSCRGRKPIKRLFDKLTDNQVVNYFKDALSAARETCREYYEGIKQYCVCFYKSAFMAFSPCEDPYGKLSHYHEIISGEIDKIPSRKTLSNGYNWFENWKKNTIKTAKERYEALKHKMWELLMMWIYHYLLRIAPQYAIVQ